MTDWRAIAFWFLGAFFVFFGVLIGGNVEPSALGATSLSVALAYIIAFILILLGGMFWISTAVAHIEE
jgi:VIT1/CCC1 family predicted Fe2+/Mn2+ transporter